MGHLYKTSDSRGLSVPPWGYMHVFDHYLSLVMRNPAFCICENKDEDQLCSNCAADQRHCFLIWIVQSLYYLNLKFQASSYLLWLYSPVSVGPGRKPRRPVFLQRGSFSNISKTTWPIKAKGHMTLRAIHAQFLKDQNSALKLLLLF